MRQEREQARKINYALLLVVFISIIGCKSATDTDEFVENHKDFLSEKTHIVRATLYAAAYKGNDNFWKEDALKSKSRNITVRGKEASELWFDLERDELSYKIRPVATQDLKLALIFENNLSQKFQLTIDCAALKNGKFYLFCNRPRRDDWWSEAKSANWKKHFGTLLGL